jgi:hypothetical protein
MKAAGFLLSIVASLFLAGCVISPDYIGPDEVSATPDHMPERLQYRGFSLARPEHPGWFVKVSEQSHTHAIIRCKLPGPTHTAFVSVNLGALPRAASSREDFAELAREDHIKDTNRFAIISYQQTEVMIQGQWAIKYEIRIRDSATTNSPDRPLIMLESGFVVNQPTFTNGVLRFFYSERGLPEELNPVIEADGKSIISGVRLESEPGKPLGLD